MIGNDCERGRALAVAVAIHVSLRKLPCGLAYATDETKLLGSVRLHNSSEILVLGPHLCTSICVCAMIGLLKKPLWI